MEESDIKMYVKAKRGLIIGKICSLFFLAAAFCLDFGLFGDVGTRLIFFLISQHFCLLKQF